MFDEFSRLIFGPNRPRYNDDFCFYDFDDDDPRGVPVHWDPFPYPNWLADPENGNYNMCLHFVPPKDDTNN